MSKKKHPKAAKLEPRAEFEKKPFSTGISARGWKVIAGGVLTVALGFWVLSLTDPAGENWASHLSPFLILGGYVSIGIGILLADSLKIDGSSALPSKEVAQK